MDLGILFLGGAKRVSLANRIITTAKSMGYETRIFSYELEKEVPIASVGSVIIGLRWADPGIIDHLAETIRRNHIDIVLPFVDPAVEVAAALKGALPDIFVPVSPRELCAAMFDKVTADSLFRQKGVPVPENLGTRSLFPQIWKPRKGSASSGIIIVENESDLPHASPREYLIQRYIPNAKEYTVDCYLSEEGKITSVVPRERLATVGGEVIRSVTVRDSELISLSRRILTSFPFRGPVTLQFLRDSEGRTFLMEINPRLGGGVVASIAAGSRILEMLILESRGSHISPFDGWEENTLITRYLQETVFHDYNKK